MKSALVVAFTLSVAEARYIHEVLCTTPIELSEAATDLHDGLAEGLQSLAGSTIPDSDIAIDLKIGAGLLDEIVPLFSKRSKQIDEDAGLDPDIGYAIADSLLTTKLSVTRATQRPTSAELAGLITELQSPQAAPSFSRAAARFFSSNKTRIN